MRTHKSVSINNLILLCLICTICLFNACRSVEVEQSASEPVFFPPPPEVPRLQFLTSFSEPEDLVVKTAGGFERFVLGETEELEGITAPYGTALFEGKLYVCDVGSNKVAVFDLQNRTFGHLKADQQLKKPVNIFIDDNGWKYVTDSIAGLVFVFDQNDRLINKLGQQLEISPVDIVVRGTQCYVTDSTSNQVIVLDKMTGREIMRIGMERKPRVLVQSQAELPPGEFSIISDLALDQQGNIYVTDKAGARITEFSSSGIFKRTVGRLGDHIDEFVRPKGIAIDRMNRIWVVDTATEVAKIYNDQGQLLLFFGQPGNKPGMMNLPATIDVDYDNVELFRKYAVEGASIEFLVLVSNQYGPHKISIYGFGTFPVRDKAKK